MTLEEARELVKGPLWPKVRDSFLATGVFAVYPTGDIRRLDYLDKNQRDAIALWQEGLRQAEGWRKVVDGAKVRELRAKFPGVYPEAIRFLPYFKRYIDGADGAEFPPEAVKLLLKLKFPEAYRLCFC